MPMKRCVVRVDPQGKAMVVDILDTSGVSVTAYESSEFAAARLTLPMTITGQTDFCLPSPGPYDVSCKVGGTEVANSGAAKRVQAGDTPVRVVPDWERELAGADSAASSPFVELTVPTAESDWHIEYGGGGDTWGFPGGGVIQNLNDGSVTPGGFLTSLVDFWGSGGVFECTVLIPSAGQLDAQPATVAVQLFTDEPNGTAAGAGGAVGASALFADGSVPFQVSANADGVSALVTTDPGIALDVPFIFRVEAVGPVVVVKINGTAYAQTSGAQSVSDAAADQSRIQLSATGLVTFSDFHMWVPNTPTAS